MKEGEHWLDSKVFIGQYTESSGMTTKETGIPTLYLTKRKRNV